MIEENMTIFYYKSNGDIYSACTGIQDKNVYFGIHIQDLNINEIVLPFDDYVLMNTRLFKIDITKNPVELVMLPLTIQYPIASS